jgi:hephaestin
MLCALGLVSVYLQRRSAAWEHLGLLGPVIRGVVGDTLKVHFRNNLKEHNASMHPHGVWYDKESEGSPYNDGLPSECQRAKPFDAALYLSQSLNVPH